MSQAPSTQSTTTGDSAAIIPQSPTSLALAALNMTRDDLARHTDQMRCFLSASAPPIHTLPQNHIIHPYPTHPSSSLTPVKSETPDPPQVLPTRPSMDAVLERGERRKKDLKRLYSTNSIPSSTTTNTNPFDDHPTNNNSPNTTPEDLPATSGSGNNNMTSATPATQSDNALPNPSILYPVAPTPLDARTIAKGASRSSSVCSSLAYQQDVFYPSRPPSVAPSASLSHPSVRRSQSIASQVSGLHSGVGDDLEDPDVGQVHAESVDEILGLAPAPSRQYNPEATDAVSSGQQNPGISLTMQTPVKVPPQLVASGSTPYQPVPMPSSSVTRVGAYPSSSPVYKYQPATSPAGPRTPFRPPIHLKHPVTTTNVVGRPRNALPSSSPMPFPATSSPAHDSSPVNPAALPFRLPPGPRLTSKPHYSYAALIGQALMSSPTKRLSLNQIYTWISMAYPYFKRGEAGWQNSIRHNLSLNGCFVKIKRDDGEKGKGSWWSIREGDEPCFAGGGFQRQGRANGRKRKGKADKEQDGSAEAADATEQDDEGASPKKKKKTAATSTSRSTDASDPNSMIPRGGYSRSASTSTTATSVHTMASSASYESVASYANGGYGVPIYYGATPYGGGYVQYAAAPPSVGPSFPSAAHAVPAEPSAAFAGPSVERGRSTHIRIPASNGYSLRPAASSHPSSSPLASRSTRSLEMSSEDEEEEEPESEDDGFQNASNRAMAEMRMPPHHSPVRGLAAAQSPTRSIRSPTAYMDGGRMPDVREMYDDISHERHMDSGTMDEDERTEAGRGQSPTAHDAAVSSQEAAPAPLGLPFALNESSAPAVDLGSEEGEENSQPAEASALQPGFHFVPPLPKTSSQSAEDGVVKQDPETGARGLEDDGFSNFFSSSPVHQRSRQNARFSTARASGSGSDLLSRVIESKTAKRGVRPQSTNNASPTKGIFPAVPTTPRRDTRLRTPPPPSERVPKDPSLENEEDKLLKEMDPTVAAAVSALTSLSPMRTPVSHAALHMSPAPPRSSDLAQYKHSLGPQSPFRTPGRTPSGRAFDYYDYLGDGVGGSADDSATKSMLGTGLLPRTPATPMTGGIFGSHNLYQSPSLPSPGWRRY